MYIMEFLMDSEELSLHELLEHQHNLQKAFRKARQEVETHRKEMHAAERHASRVLAEQSELREVIKERLSWGE